MAFKMKGSPMKRNFDVGASSPAKQLKPEYMATSQMKDLFSSPSGQYYEPAAPGEYRGMGEFVRPVEGAPKRDPHTGERIKPTSVGMKPVERKYMGPAMSDEMFEKKDQEIESSVPELSFSEEMDLDEKEVLDRMKMKQKQRKAFRDLDDSRYGTEITE
jgi:hypothetical protein